MDEITIKTIFEVNDKLGWAIRAYEKIRKNKKDKYELQDNFWSYLSAFQQAWFYFSKLVQELNPDLSKKKLSELSKTLIEEWKYEKLNDTEKTSWEILQKLRNDDTHRAPVNSNYVIKKHALKTNSGKILTTNSGKILVGTSEKTIVLFEGKEHDIERLTSNGISAIRKLINYMPLIKQKTGANN